MSPTATVTTNGPFSSSASSFITLVGDDAKVGQEKKIEKPVFVLNSSDFVALQAYLIAGIKAPATNALYDSEYPKDAFEKYLKVDTTLYEGLRDQMVLIHKHCESFQGQVVTPMITTGGEVADFGEFSKEAVTTILDGVKILIDASVKKTDPKFEDAKGSVRSACRKVVSRADSVKASCDQLVKDLGEFRAQTESDKAGLTKLNGRFKKVMPTKEEQDADMSSLISKAEDLYKAAKKSLDDTRKEYEETGQVKWYHYIPIIGAIILIYDIVKQGKLLDKIKEIEKDYQNARAKGAEDQVKLAKAYTVINHLAGDMDAILAAIDGAISSVTKMSVAFSTLSTNFKKVRDYLGDVQDDINETTLKERGVAIDDLHKAKTVWESVESLGRAFQQNGGLLSFDPKNPPKPSPK